MITGDPKQIAMALMSQMTNDELSSFEAVVKAVNDPILYSKTVEGMDEELGQRILMIIQLLKESKNNERRV